MQHLGASGNSGAPKRGKIITDKRTLVQVKRDGLSHAIGTFKRALEQLARFAANKSVTIVYKGMECHTNGKVITLPDISLLERPNMTVEEITTAQEYLEAVRGMVYHEVGHILYTDFAACEEAVRRERGPIVKEIWNAFEDVFIERKLVADLAGTVVILDNLGEWCNRSLMEKFATGNVGMLTKVVMGVCVVSKHGTDHWFYDQLDPVAKDILKHLGPEIAKARELSNSWETLGLATDVLAKIEKLTAPPPPKPPPSKKGKKEKGDSGTEEGGDDSEDGSDDDSVGDSEDDADDAGDSSGDEGEDADREGADDSDSEDDEEGDEGGADSDGDEDAESDGGEEGDDDSPDSEDEDGSDSDDADEERPSRRNRPLAEEDEDQPEEEDEDEGTEGDEDKDEEDGEEGDEDDDSPDSGGASNSDSEADDDAEESDEEPEDLDDTARQALKDDLDRNEEETAKDLHSADKAEQVSSAIKHAVEGTTDTDRYLIYTTEFDKVTSFDVTEDSRRAYHELALSLRDPVATGKRQLANLLKARTLSHTAHDLEEGKLDRTRLYRFATRGDKRIFKETVERTDLKGVSCVLMINLSASMSTRVDDTKSSWDPKNSRLYLAKEAALIFSECLDSIHIPFEVIGHSTTHYEGADTWKECPPDTRHLYTRWGGTIFETVKTFEEDWSKVGSRIMNMEVRYNTHDAEAVQLAAQHLLLRREDKRRIIFMLDDGEPCPNLWDSRGGMYLHNDPDWALKDGWLARHQDALRKTVKEVTDRGVEVIGVGMGTDSVSRYYPDHLTVMNLGDFSKMFIDKLKKILLPGSKRS